MLIISSVFNREDQQVVMHSNDDIAPVAYIRFKTLSLKPKEGVNDEWKQKVHSPMHFVKEIVSSCSNQEPCTHVSTRVVTDPTATPLKVETIDVSSSFLKLFVPVTDGKIGRALHIAAAILKERHLDLRFVTQVLMFVRSM